MAVDSCHTCTSSTSADHGSSEWHKCPIGYRASWDENIKTGIKVEVEQVNENVPPQKNGIKK